MIVPWPSTDQVRLRPYRPEDCEPTFRVFREAVIQGASGHYTDLERLAWSRHVIGLTLWARERNAHPTWVAEACGSVLGFADLTEHGEVGMLYVHPAHARRGVGKALLDEVERQARELGLKRLHACASLVAEPLFKRQGFAAIAREHVELQNQRLKRTRMLKILEPLA